MPDTAGESLRSARPGLPEQRKVRRRRLILAACLIATFMAAVESTIVASATSAGSICFLGCSQLTC